MNRNSPNRRGAHTTSRNRKVAQASLASAGVGSAFGLLAGAGVGAAMMFLLDPSRGAQRRRQMIDSAGGAFHTVSDKISDTLHSASSRAMDAGASLASSVPQPDDVQRRGGEMIQHARHRLANFIGGREESGYIPKVTMSVAALGAGLGAMWFFDPDRGRARRAWIGQKLTRAANESGHFMRATGRHIRNKFTGYYHESISTAQEMMPGRTEDSTDDRAERAAGDRAEDSVVTP